ncbi:hypothetical protein ACRYI5_01465 [Furfurilactobacillus sp. WILCCON 0119]
MDDDENWKATAFFDVKKSNNYSVIETEDDRFYLMSVYRPWYGIYGFLSSTNRRQVMEVPAERAKELRIDIKEENFAQELWAITIICIAVLGIKLWMFLSLAFDSAFQEYAGLIVIVLGIIAGIIRLHMMEKRERQDIQEIKEFQTTHTMKIRSNAYGNFLLLMIASVCMVIAAYVYVKILVVPTIGIFWPLLYGPSGKRVYKKAVDSDVPGMSFYRWKDWGNEEIIGMEDPSESLPVVKVEKKNY